MLPELSQQERNRIADTWDFRASAERSAQRRFTRLANELENTGAPVPILDLMHRAIDDETRHIKLCDTLARAYGWSQPPSPPTPHHPIGPAGVSQGDRLLYEMVAFCCITETLNASMLLTIHRRVIATDIKDAIHTILKDEINHSKVGWAYLEYRRSQGDGDALSAWLPRMFKGAGVDEVHTPDSGGRDSDRMADYGELSFAMRVQIFAAAVRDVIFPGLERHGIDTARSRTWLEQFQAPTQAPDSPT